MIKLPSHKEQRAREHFQFACPPRPDLKLILPLFFFSGVWIQEQRSIMSDLAEVKHLGDGVGERIEGTLANALSAEPVVFDEPGNRSLVGDAVIHGHRGHASYDPFQGRPKATESVEFRER